MVGTGPLVIEGGLHVGCATIQRWISRKYRTKMPQIPKNKNSKIKNSGQRNMYLKIRMKQMSSWYSNEKPAADPG